MAYAILAAELSINTKKFEQGLEFADSMGRAFVRPTRLVKLGLDFKSLDSQLKQAESRFKATLKPITLPIELQLRVNGQQIVIEQSKLAEKTIRSQETATKQLVSALKSLEGRGYAAFAGTLRGAVDAEVALSRAQAKLRELGTIKPPSSAWSMPVGNFNKVKEAEADLKRLGASLERDSKFTRDFNAHLQKMQGLIDGAAAKGEKLGSQIANRLLATAKNAEGANNAFSLMGRGLSAIGTVGTGVSRVLLGLGRNLYNFIRGHLLMPVLTQGIQSLQDATVGYNITVERTTTSLTSMFKGNQKAAKGLLNDIEDLAIRTSYSFENMAQLTPMLVTAGVAAKDVVQTFTALGDASVAGSKGVEGVKNLVGDILSMSSRGKVTGMDIRNFGANSVKIVKYLAQAYSSILPKGTKDAELAMREMITKGLIPADKAIKAIVAGIENDPLKAGLMAKQARTYEGAMSNIGDAIKRALGKEAFSGVFELMTKSALAFVDFVSSPKFTAWGRSLAPKLRDFAVTAINVGAKVYEMGSQIVKAVTWASSIVADKIPYAVGLLAMLGSAKIINGIRMMGNTLTVAFLKANAPILIATAAVVAFIAAYRNISFIQDLTYVVVGGTLEALKGLSFGLQKIRGEVGAAVQGIGWLFGKQEWVDFGKSQQGLEKSTAKWWDGVIDGWVNTGNKKMKAFLTSDYSKMLGMDDITKSLFGNIEKTVAGVKIPMPEYGLGDTNQNGKDQAKEQKKALQELAKSYDELGKAAEKNAKRQLDALKGVADTLQGVFGNIQQELAKFGVFDSPITKFIKSIESLTNLGGRADNVVQTALARMAKYSADAKKSREAAQKIGQVLGTGEGGTAGSRASSRILTTFKTTEEIRWSEAFKAIAAKSARVQELVRTQFSGSWEKMFATMAKTIEARKRLERLATPVSSSSVERFLHPEQWSAKRYSALVDQFRVAAQMQLGPRASVPAISPNYANGNIQSGVSSDYYNQLVEKKARELAGAYLRRTGQLQTVTTTLSGYPKNFDFGTIKRTQQQFQQRVTVAGQALQSATAKLGEMPVSTALVGAGKTAGKTLIENLVREFNDKSPTSLGASCADVASKVLNAIGYNLRYSANARQLLNNAKAAGWMPVPLGTPGALHVQTGKGFGKISGAHTTVGIGNGMVAGSSGYKFQEYNIVGAKGNPIALMPKNAVGNFRVPSFANNPMGVGGVAALQNGDNGPQAFLEQIQELLKGLKLSKLTLPKEWGKPVKEAAEQANVFAVQMMLANENTQNLLRALYGDKFKAIVQQLRQAAYAADQFIGKLKAGETIANELRSLSAKRRARGRENDPFFALSERQRPGGDLALAPTWGSVSTKLAKAQAKVLDAVIKSNTLGKGIQGPTLPVDKIDGLKTRAADLRRMITDSSALLSLQSKVLRDALDSQTFAIKENVRGLQDRKKVLESGAKFVTAATFDEYGYTRALELRAKEVEYWASAEVKALAGRASALEKFVNDNTLAKGAQGPTAPRQIVLDAKNQAHEIRRTLNMNADWMLKSAASVYDFEKAFGRTIDMAKTRQEMDRRLGQLQEQIGLINDTKLSVGQLNLSLEKSGFFYDHIYRLQEAGYGENSTRLANELSLRQQIAAALERAIEAGKEWRKSVQEFDINRTLSAQLRGLYAKMQSGPALDRAIFEKQTRSELQARYDNGDFDVPTNTITTTLRAMRGVITAPQLLRDPLELEKRVQQALQGFDTKSATDRVAEANAKWTQMSLDLEQRQAELLRPLSELDKARLDFKTKGVAQSTEEFDLQGKILAIARQLDNISLVPLRKQMGQQFQLAEIFDPKKRADLQLRFDHPEWSEETLNQILPVDRLLRKFTEAREQMQGLMDGWRDSWQNMFRDIAQKGQFSFGSFLDNITNRLAQWGADIISNAGWQALQGLLTKFAGGILRTNTMGSATVKYGTPDTVYGPTAASANGLFRTTSAMSHDYMMQAARDLSAGATRSTSAVRSSSDEGSGNTYLTINHTGDIKANSPTDYKREIESIARKGTGNSRRTDMKNLRRGTGYIY